jgi:hypothetical protein
MIIERQINLSHSHIQDDDLQFIGGEDDTPFSNGTGSNFNFRTSFH